MNKTRKNTLLILTFLASLLWSYNLFFNNYSLPLGIEITTEKNSSGNILSSKCDSSENDQITFISGILYFSNLMVENKILDFSSVLFGAFFLHWHPPKIYKL